MLKFNTQYDRRPPVFQEAGSAEHVIYSPRYDETGVLDLVPTGKENLYEYIQSHKESTDIHYLLDRFANGEVDVLSRMQGFYADVSDMPKTYAEVLNSVIAGEEAFSRLPSEIKQKFGNSFAVWLSAMDSPDFAEKMGYASPADSSMTDSQVQDFTNSSDVPSTSTVAPSSTPVSTTPAESSFGS